VIGEVHYRRTRSRSLVFDAELAFIGKCVDDTYSEFAWVTFFAVGGGIGEGDLVRSQLFAIPDDGIEALESTVQAVRAIIDRELIACAIDGEVTSGDTIRIAPADSTEVGFFTVDIFVETVVTEDDVCITCAAGDYERDELSTLVDEVRFGSCLIDQSVELDGFTVYDSTEGLMGEPGFILLHR
jgi:hypothetical protein